AGQFRFDAPPNVRGAAPVQVPQRLAQPLVVVPGHGPEELLAVHALGGHGTGYRGGQMPVGTRPAPAATVAAPLTRTAQWWTATHLRHRPNHTCHPPPRWMRQTASIDCGISLLRTAG